MVCKLRMGFIIFLTGLVLNRPCLAQQTEPYVNPSENINPDPNYVPGDYVMPDTNQSRIVYETAKAELANLAVGLDSQTATTLGLGEIKFRSIKNETAEVLGYFRHYFGLVRFKDGEFGTLDMVVDINSLDTGVPGRNNRVLDILLQSAVPELGVVKIHFEEFRIEGGESSLGALQPGKSYAASASGSLVLNGRTLPVQAVLSVVKKENGWVVETTAQIPVRLSDLGYGARVYDLMRSCNHKSISDTVEIGVKLYFS
ncbi:MAG: hypothetical protein A2Z83_01245 [Omnitrophica bacterium GWA2_52_8]|nr:MAG: hypothetical protein A2Z83_01245 [Omnitrophica bacterium GWA2_52_8]